MTECLGNVGKEDSRRGKLFPDSLESRIKLCCIKLPIKFYDFSGSSDGAVRETNMSVKNFPKKLYHFSPENCSA